MSLQSNNSILVQNVAGITSPTFINKKSDDSLLSYQVGQSKLTTEYSLEQVITAISEDIDSNPDGWIIFVSNEFKETVKKLIQKEFLYSYGKNTLTFNNGQRSETILFHNITPGLLIEFIDPSYGSLFFSDLIEKIQNFIDQDNLLPSDLCIFQITNMSSNMHLLKDEYYGYKFLNILKNNNLSY